MSRICSSEYSEKAYCLKVDTFLYTLEHLIPDGRDEIPTFALYHPLLTRLHYSDSHIRDQLKFNAHLNHNCLFKGEMSGHLHDELPPPGHAPLRYECVDRLLLLLGLLDLDQPRDGVDGRTLLKERCQCQQYFALFTSTSGPAPATTTPPDPGMRPSLDSALIRFRDFFLPVTTWGERKVGKICLNL